ncbi:MAG: histidine kinase [Verrucomicrobiota bacterium]
MKFSKHVILAFVAIAYSAMFTITFDAWNNSTMILSIVLAGLCGWFYGNRTGLLLIIPIILLNTALMYFTSSDPIDIQEINNPIGIILGTIVVISTSSLKKSFEKVEALKSSASLQVGETTSELDKIARQLIEKDEQERIQMGQDLHDGVGQYLTSMLLHSEALSLSLKAENRSEAGLAERMTWRIQNNIQTVRQLSRSLLPIQFTETDLETAMNEMASYFDDISSANIQLRCQGDSSLISILTAQHLYRIAQEVIYMAVCRHVVSNLDIKLNVGKQNCRLNVKSSGTIEHPLPPTGFISEIMKYRIRAIDGKLAFTNTTKGGFRLDCTAGLGKDGR